MLGNNVTWICGRRTGGCINQTEKNRRFENKKKKDNKKWKKKTIFKQSFHSIILMKLELEKKGGNDNLQYK